ncbi:site-specific DNA-methyltransferase [Epilithonimonas mollis]|uniref:site-specific DNA-methyltransferase (adenine-specific) n=1 Tax=Epilithonimonas mollis TaxID=216903 RepID=A0A1M6MZJ9_9FLAO|nr:site-specific DNA-methyltransferase [Epilithonimonas mollis]SHJ88871.1 adenine-specific DNA-methyltransferase [Epilithonimonas mollis]
MEKITELTSEDIVTQNIERLKEIFPTAFSEGKLVVDELEALVGEYIQKDKEFYQMTWAGKTEAQKEANKVSTGTLRPSKEESKDWDTTGNIFIEGDNLEVLKLLQKSYSNKIKMIYIDPPYNTGKDFVYKDNYKDNLSNYLELTGQTDEEGKKLSTNTDSDGRYHSNWLNMMYPRLKLARNLMADDGVIFLSIDDNEQSNLKKLCDEIFGDENFITNVIWHKKYGAANDAQYFSDVHDFILVYCKNKTFWKPNLMERPDELNAKYKNPDNDSRGPWIATNLSVKTYSKNNDYIITGPNGQKYTPPPSRAWVVSQEKYSELLRDNRITFGKDGNSRPYSKTFLSEVQNGIVPITIWNYNDFGHNIGAKSEIRDLFKETTVPFDTPKPTKLLKQIIKIAERSKNDIILDFFSGSGTTAHAVMALNAEDEGNRKCISVQLPEPTDERSEAYKAGYKTIAEITKERIRRAGELIKKENKDKEGIENLDTGFRVFKLDSSNINAWDTSVDEFEGQLDLYAENNGDHIKTNRTEEDVLFEILLKYGLELTLPIQEKQIGDNTIYNIGFGSMYICLSDHITIEVAKTIGEWHKESADANPAVIFKDSGFASDADKTNTIQTLRQVGIENVKSI